MPIPNQFNRDPMSQGTPAFRSSRTPAPAPAPAPGPSATYAEMEAMLRAADAAGDTEAATMLTKAIDEGNYIKSQNSLVSAGLGFSQGSTLGTGDEIAAGIRGMVEQKVDPYMFAIAQKFLGGAGDTSKWIGAGDKVPAWKDKTFSELVDMREKEFWDGKSLKDRYENALSGSRGMLETARRENPAATFAGEMAGSVGLTAGPVNALVKGSRVIPGLAKLTGLGALEGGAAGYGYSEGDPLAAMAQEADAEKVSSEAQQAAVDAGIGASVGGGVGLLLPLSSTVARSVGRLFAKPFTKGVRLKEDARKQVVASIREDLETGQMTLKQAQDEIDNTPGMTVADLGAATQDLTQKTVQTPYAGSRQLDTWLKGRNKEQWSRMHPRLASAITGDTKDNFRTAQRNLLQKMKADADTAYGAVENDLVRMTPELLTTMRLKPFKAALKNTNDLRYLEGMEPLAKKLKGGDQLTVKEMDQIVQGMDDVVSQAWKKRPAVAKALTAKRNEFRELLYEQSPGLRDARKAWAGDKLNEEAMSMGEKILRDDADLIVDQIRNMSKSERDNFKIGALRAISRRLGNKSDTADLTKGIFDRKGVRDAVRVAFGSKKKFNDFMDYVSQEQKMFDTFSKATANSSTARRIAQQNVDMGGKLAALFGYGASMSTGAGLPPSIGGYLSRKAYEASIPKGAVAQRAAGMAQNQADMLMSGNLGALMRPNTIGGLLDTGIPTTGAIGTTGLLGTGVTQSGTNYGEF